MPALALPTLGDDCPLTKPTKMFSMPNNKIVACTNGKWAEMGNKEMVDRSLKGEHFQYPTTVIEISESVQDKNGLTTGCYFYAETIVAYRDIRSSTGELFHYPVRDGLCMPSECKDVKIQWPIYVPVNCHLAR